MKLTKGKRPRTGERKLRIQFRNGQTCEGVAASYRWTDNGDPFDIVACEYADKAVKS